MRSRSREHMKCTCCAILLCKAVSHCIRKSCILKHPYPIYVLVLSEQTNSIELIRLRSTMTLMYSSAFREHTLSQTHTHTQSASIELAHNFLVHLHGLMQLSKIALRVGHLLALGFLTISVVCVDISRHSSDKSTSPNPEKYRLEAMLMGKSHETHQALNYLFFY